MGDEEWDRARGEMAEALFSLLKPAVASRLGNGEEERNTLLVLLSGLTSTADWIGSMEEYFPFATAPVDLEEYAKGAAERAKCALKKLGWIGWQPPQDGVSFEQIFPFSPRPMQQAVVGGAAQFNQPGLVIIEAPTGIGKTEAALYLADHWARVCQQRGTYVAMPTMATSNQMFGRTREMLARRYPENLINVHLVHGQARWSEDVQALRLQIAPEDPQGTVAAMAWFLPRKRGLLAPFGVGTVDQALLSVLQTRHFFVRLFGLSHKTVIFDEVHAYDTYMSALFQRLLGWLRAVGTSVVILSATLPASTRRELLQAYSGREDLPLEEVSYPALTWVMGNQAGVIPLPCPENRTIDLEWITGDSIVQCLRERLPQGGCAAVICNRVRQAQEVYRAIRDAGLVSQEDLILFHARFPLAWRNEIEDKVLTRFGKNGQRPEKAIVVATQVIEQSLDLDFDLLVSYLSPLDLLIQRAGRLWRHERQRPASLSGPRLLLVRPGETDGRPDFGPDVYVYEPYTLLRSYLALRGREQMILPKETVELIEAVYGDEEPTGLSPALAGALEKAREQRDRHQREHIFQAQQKLIPSCQKDLLEQGNAALEEDSPDLHQAFQALTRLTPPGISLVCLHARPDGLSTEPSGGVMVDLTREPDDTLTRELALHTVTVTHPDVVNHFRSQEIPPAWREHSLLHDHRPAIFTDGCCRLEGTEYTLRLSRDLGLEIVQEV